MTGGALAKFLQKLQAGGEGAGKLAVGLGGRAAKGVKEHPVMAGAGMAGGYGLSEALEEEDPDTIRQLLMALGLVD